MVEEILTCKEKEEREILSSTRIESSGLRPAREKKIVTRSQGWWDKSALEDFMENSINVNVT